MIVLVSPFCDNFEISLSIQLCSSLLGGVGSMQMAMLSQFHFVSRRSSFCQIVKMNSFTAFQVLI